MSDLLTLLPATQWEALRVFVWVPALALAIDWCLGEPRAAWHPVVWMGRALHSAGERLAPTSPVANDWKCFWLAALVWCALAAIVFVVLSTFAAGRAKAGGASSARRPPLRQAQPEWVERCPAWAVISPRMRPRML